MKILQIIPNFGMGGAETMCEELVYRLREMGNEVSVISLFSQETIITQRLRDNGVSVIFLDKKPGFDFSLISKLRNCVKNIAPNIIHTHLGAAPYATIACRKMNVHVVHTVHNVADKESGNIVRTILNWGIKKGYVHLVALSNLIKETIMQNYRVNLSDIPIIFNGINLRNCIRKSSYETSDNIISFLHVGRFSEQKNHIGLLRAFSILTDKVSNVKLHLVGDGVLREEAVQFVEDNDMRDNVVFWGELPDVYKIMNESDVFILPSLYEGMPITLIEAMGTGMPIIATNVGGVPDILKDNFSGLLVENNTTDIVESMKKLYYNANVRKRLGLTALSESENFSSTKMAYDYYSYYKNLCGAN